jgi:hypothetical protein
MLCPAPSFIDQWLFPALHRCTTSLVFKDPNLFPFLFFFFSCQLHQPSILILYNTIVYLTIFSLRSGPSHEKELDKIKDEDQKYQRLVELNVLEQARNVIKTAMVQKSYHEHA